MSRLPTIALLALLAAGACKTPQGQGASAPEQVEAKQPVESQPEGDEEASGETPAGEPDAFATAVGWLESREPTTAPVEAVSSSWSKPWVERMHREGAGYRALVLGGESPAEGVLLTVERRDGSWEVVAAEVVAADYLWPRK